MGKPKGLPKTGGRKKGTTNVFTKEIREQLEVCLDNNFEKFQSMLDRVVDPEKWVAFYIKLLEFRVPKMQSVAVTAGKNVSDFKSELDKLAETES